MWRGEFATNRVGDSALAVWRSLACSQPGVACAEQSGHEVGSWKICREQVGNDSLNRSLRVPHRKGGVTHHDDHKVQIGVETMRGTRSTTLSTHPERYLDTVEVALGPWIGLPECEAAKGRWDTPAGRYYTAVAPLELLSRIAHAGARFESCLNGSLRGVRKGLFSYKGLAPRGFGRTQVLDTTPS